MLLIFSKNFKKNKTYIIYNIDPSEFANHDTSYTVDPEKFIIFLASEYIKQKKFNFIIKEKFVEKPLQNKFSKFHLNEVYSKNKIKKLHFLISKLFFKFYRPKIIFDDLMIKYSDMIKLNLALGQLPLQWSIRYNAFKNKYNLEKRVLLINSIKSKIFYDNYLNSILIKILPSGYLENFDEIVEHVLKTYPLKYSSYISDNISSLPSKKIFIQLMKTKGTKIFIIQHGGMYGFLENKIGEISERLMSNNFLTWGWKRTNKDKIFFSLKFLNLQKNSKSTGSNNKILICSNLRTNYFNVITAQPSCPKICDENWENLKIFCSFFNKKFKEEINIRYLKKTQNSGFEFNEKKFPKFIKFDHAKDKLKNVLSQFKLVVHDGLYSTAFLETLYLDKPTLALINPKDIKDYSFEFRKEINNLKNIGMIHTNVKSLKKFLLKIIFQLMIGGKTKK